MFFKRKSKIKIENENEKEEVVIEENELVEVKKSLENKIKNGEENIELLIEITSLCMQLKHNIDAIYYLEKILSINKKLGKNYNDLMNLYNSEMRLAAVNKDNEKVQYYLNKIDELMQLSKDVIRGKYEGN